MWNRWALVYPTAGDLLPSYGSGAACIAEPVRAECVNELLSGQKPGML